MPHSTLVINVKTKQCILKLLQPPPPPPPPLLLLPVSALLPLLPSYPAFRTCAQCYNFSMREQCAYSWLVRDGLDTALRIIYNRNRQLVAKKICGAVEHACRRETLCSNQAQSAPRFETTPAVTVTPLERLMTRLMMTITRSRTFNIPENTCSDR